MFVRVTGGMSREDGGLKPVADVALWAVRPVRMIGGWRRVEMAVEVLVNQISDWDPRSHLPFWSDSAIEL